MDEYLYIAGPECFYPNGDELWWSQRKLAEYHGFSVVLPTSTKLQLDHEDIADNAREIFSDLVEQVKKTTMIIADLESFRGYEPDGGTVFELGWIYAKGGRCYGYAHDVRSVATRNERAEIENGVVMDGNGWPQPYADQVFCPSILGSTTVVAGDFSDCLQVAMVMKHEESRLDEKAKRRVWKKKESGGRPKVFVAASERYSPEYDEYCENVRKSLEPFGIEAVFPVFDPARDEDAFRSSARILDTWLEQLCGCDALIADVNDYHGFEPSNDVAFVCGFAYGIGLPCFSMMRDLRPMQERIPNRDGLDKSGYVVENFNGPINLMFTCSSTLFAGSMQDGLGDDLLQALVTRIKR